VGIRETTPQNKDSKMTTAAEKKITIATVKSFIRKHRNNGLLIRVASHFNGMSDMVEQIEDDGFTPALSRTYYCHETFGYVEADKNNSSHLGINGVWFVGSGGNRCNVYETETHIGYEVYNCCGNWMVAIAK
jgi:hypothetical protein